jgi:hypothetical protein
LGCSHSSTITTITAGLAREVCETCAHVSLHYVESAVQLRPPLAAVADEPVRIFEARVTIEETPRYRRCRLCAQPAVFMIPDGMMCDEHAWQAAARLSWDDSDPWVPIRIDKSNA